MQKNKMLNNIAVLLPYKDQFVKDNAGSASIWVKDFSKKSYYKKSITVFGYTSSTNKIISGIKYKNLSFGTFGLRSKNEKYVKKFINILKKKNFSLIEIHNRPSYINYIDKQIKNNKYILIIHNNPLTLRGAVTIKEREKLLRLCSKIIFATYRISCM